jgi:hypothetical protein
MIKNFTIITLLVFGVVFLNRWNIANYALINLAPKSTIMCRPIAINMDARKFEAQTIPLVINELRDIDMQMRPELYSGCQAQPPIDLHSTECPWIINGQSRKCPVIDKDLTGYSYQSPNKGDKYFKFDDLVYWAYGWGALARLKYEKGYLKNFMGSPYMINYLNSNYMKSAISKNSKQKADLIKGEHSILILNSGLDYDFSNNLEKQKLAYVALTSNNQVNRNSKFSSEISMILYIQEQILQELSLKNVAPVTDDTKLPKFKRVFISHRSIYNTSRQQEPLYELTIDGLKPSDETVQSLFTKYDDVLFFSGERVLYKIYEQKEYLFNLFSFATSKESVLQPVYTY